MEKINIAELLKDCPKGMELDCTMYEDTTLIHILEGNAYPIKIETPDGQISLNKYGQYSNNKLAKCIIFPKGKTTWEGFQRPFEDGDILISVLEDCWHNPFIFKRINGYGNAQCYCAINCFEELILNSDNWTPIKSCRPATEEEKEKLFKVIKDNGYKWNAETKTLEELVEKDELTLNEYQRKALRTNAKSSDNESYSLFGLFAEVGEIADKIAKAVRKEIITINGDFIYEGKNATKDGLSTLEYAEFENGLKAELGDVLWFVAHLAHRFGWTLEEVGQDNIDKLTSRQKRGVIIGNGDNR